MQWKNWKSCLSVLAAAGLIATSGAARADLTGGVTRVTLDSGFLSLLTSVGVAPSPIGAGSVAGSIASFPITGNTPPTSIFHNGSGLRLTRAANGTTLALENFVIDLTQNKLFGRATGSNGVNASNADIFNIGSGLVLTLTTTAAGAVNTALGLGLNGAQLEQLLIGRTVGVAAVVAPIPEPGTWALLAVGLVGLGIVARRRRVMGT